MKGECRDKRELYFRLDYAETNPTLYKYRYFLGGQTRRIVLFKIITDNTEGFNTKAR